MTTPFDTVDDYLASLPPDSRAVVEEIRRRVVHAVPAAAETIRYGIPTFTVNGLSLVHVGAWASHLSVYPPPAPDPTLEPELAPYRSGKGTLRFPLAEPIPYDLIGRVVLLLLQQRGNRGGAAD